jgi:putative DNA primase/helicase
MMPADPVAGLLDAMRAAGIEPADPGLIVADGVLRRFRATGDKPGTLNGWAVLHHDHGAAGTWKGGATCTWSSKSTSRMSRSERDAFYAKVREAKAEAQRQREVEQQQAARRAAELWDRAKPASASHPYLVKKRIEPGNARQQGEVLALRIIDINGNLHGLQYIGATGDKRMLTGTNKRGQFILTAGALPADLVLLAEGFATASTVATQFPGACVLAAIDAGNLMPVAQAVRSRYPHAEIVVCADDDRATPGNPGLTKAREAAAAVRGRIVRPIWPEGAPQSLSDFNDLAAWLIEHPEVSHA